MERQTLAGQSILTVVAQIDTNVIVSALIPGRRSDIIAGTGHFIAIFINGISDTAVILKAFPVVRHHIIAAVILYRRRVECR